MRSAVAIALLLTSPLAFAEEGAAPGAPNITVNVQQPAPPPAPNPTGRAQILNDSFFNEVGKPQAGPQNSKSAYSGTVRSMAGETDSYSGQRDLWLAACVQFRGKDSKAYRECFEAEKAKTAEALRLTREGVERRQSQPLRNSQSVPDLGDLGGERAFGGAEVESQEEKD